ncbi:MAG TPA: hypothetical protein VGD37_00020 [Kofleriaceae bacterium]
MTKLFAAKIAMIVSFVGLAACNNKKPEEGKEPLQSTAAPAPAAGAPAAGAAAAGSAATAGAAAAPAGGAAVGGGAAGGATTPSPVACATTTALRCDLGQTDGCTGGLTSVHLCVAGDAKAGTPCAQGAALTCPTGQVDACTYTPPYASNHVCVVVPRPTP